MAKHDKDTSGNPQSTAETNWHCNNCHFTTKDTDQMARHVENCRD